MTNRMSYSWIDKTEYPFKSNYYEINGCQLHYIDEGEGRTVLFVHGTPSWSFEFRNIIKELRKYCRCIAIDHIGFGLSDKPKDYDYSCENHYQTLRKFIAFKKLKSFSLFVHDFGGPIGFQYAVLHPETVDNFVIMNTWMWSLENHPEFNKIKKRLESRLLPFLYKQLNFSAKVLLPASFGEKKISRHLLKQFSRPFSKPSERIGTLAFARSLIHDNGWFESLWQQRQKILEKPVLFVWGMKDPFLKPDFLHRFQQQFSNSKLTQLPQCGHFPQEEDPEAVVGSVHNFLTEQNYYDDKHSKSNK